MSSKRSKVAKSLPASTSSLKSGPRASTSSAKRPVSTLSRISELEQKLIVSTSKNADLNPIIDLLEYAAESPKLKVRTAALHSLHNVFSTLIRQGKVIGKVRQSDDSSDSASIAALNAVREWTRARWHDYQKLLCGLLPHEEGALACTVLNISMSLLRTTSEVLSELQSPPSHVFDNDLWKRIMQALLLSPQGLTPEVQAEFVNRYLNAYDDLRYHFLKTLSELADESTAPFISTGLFLLESLTTMPTEEDQLNAFWTGKPRDIRRKKSKRQSQSIGKKRKRPAGDIDESTGIFDDTDDDSMSDEGQDTPQPVKSVAAHELLNLQAHRKVFSNAWRAFLACGLDEEQIKRVLVMLHRQVMPHLIDPSLLIDFLADCADYGGTTGLLALNGLFTLITKHGLEYPNFFYKLYSLLDSEVLHVRYRPRFMRMLDTFLASPLLPVALIASFIKRLARLCLRAPPAAIITIIPFVYNQLKRHPALMTLIHSPTIPEADVVYEDPFNGDEPDPLKTGAVESSLWELASMRSHYHPSISTLAKIFEEAFTKPNYNMEDFYDHTYTTMFDTETTRPLKKAPAMASKPAADAWNHLFPSTAQFEGAEDAEEATLALETKGDIVSRLWRWG